MCYAPGALLEKWKNLDNNDTSWCFPLTVHTLCVTHKQKEEGGGKRLRGAYRMQTIFLFLCHFQPLPPIPGQLLWKLHQPCSNKDKDGVRECGKMEARWSCTTNTRSDIQPIHSTISAFLFYSPARKRWVLITNVPNLHVQS